MMTESHVSANDRRAVFIGVDAYSDAGGSILRDLFTEDGGGYFEHDGFLGTLVLAKLQAIADEVRAEGWKWADVFIDYPRSHGLSRHYRAAVLCRRAAYHNLGCGG